MPLPRTVTDPKGVVVDGIHVPSGVSWEVAILHLQFANRCSQTNVSMCNYVVHHDPSVWGADHGIFRPERWLDTTKPLSPNDLAPFGVGHRACIGRNVALVSIMRVLATVWRRFELELVDPNEELRVESVGIGEKEGPLMVRARLRAG
jgi:cytochrome P450